MSSIDNKNIPIDAPYAKKIIELTELFFINNSLSIDQIIEKLSIKKTTCNQYIDFLKGCGALIHTHNETIHYTNPPQLISKKILNWPGEQHQFLSIDSTNNFLKTITQQPKLLSLCLSEYQYAGRGQMHRQWHSIIGENLSLSIGTSWPSCPTGLKSLSKALGVMVIRALTTVYLKQNFSLKSPNDIMHQGKKLGGILVEIQSRGNAHQVIMGIGLNVNMRQQALIDQPWTSLSIIHQQPINRPIIQQAIVNQIKNDWHIFCEHGFSAFKLAWEKAITIHAMREL